MATTRKQSRASTTARAKRDTPAEPAPIVDPEPTGDPVDPVAPEPVVGPVTDPAPNNTARPNDTPIQEQKPHFTMTTFASRAKARAAKVRREAETK